MNILLLGNGLNRINCDHSSWDRLLYRLIEPLNEQISHRGKPFPLLYEEVLLLNQHKKQLSESDILKAITEGLEEIKTNKFHVEFADLFDTILTTNYDYKIEEALIHSNIPKSSTHEILYSIYRKISIGNKNIWHIHGESNQLRSICLGYERYGANIQKIRNFIIFGNNDKNISPLKQRLATEENMYISWVDHFFKDDIYIVGLGLDFHEIDLWWLLDFRAREIYKQPKIINNKIYYYCPKHEKKVRLEVLKAMKVNIVEIEVKDSNYTNYYIEVLRKIKEHISMD